MLCNLPFNIFTTRTQSRKVTFTLSYSFYYYHHRAYFLNYNSCFCFFSYKWTCELKGRRLVQCTQIKSVIHNIVIFRNSAASHNTDAGRSSQFTRQRLQRWYSIQKIALITNYSSDFCIFTFTIHTSVHRQLFKKNFYILSSSQILKYKFFWYQLKTWSWFS